MDVMTASAVATIPLPTRLVGGTTSTPVSNVAPAIAARALAKGKEFEALYLNEMLNHMTAGLAQNTGFDGGHAEQQWRSLYNDQLGRAILAKGGLGIAQTIAASLIKAQETR